MYINRSELYQSIIAVLNEELEDKTTPKERASVTESIIDSLDGELFDIADDDDDDLEDEESEESD